MDCGSSNFEYGVRNVGPTASNLGSVRTRSADAIDTSPFGEVKRDRTNGTCGYLPVRSAGTFPKLGRCRRRGTDGN
ncbi:hypothetical protein FF011L_52980 [Roseimaritima multifibrata]|uniref:Uncharacterized protein n=1 Tax=Roseimaritima multifibrata TaxID=1930274 RepID=A0A517MNY0_9BACT|nr:hypothetical protein FF011L_52980 [Roseimaritima multifibrata]